MKDNIIKNNHTTDQATGCWLWTGATCSSGRYGRLPGGPLIMAHRYSYELHKGQINKGLFVCHCCDNGLCINPDHLFLGTPKQNARDAVVKNRLPNQSGELNHNAKYSIGFIESIRNYHSSNKCSYSKLALEFGLKSKGHAHAIVNRKIWAN